MIKNKSLACIFLMMISCTSTRIEKIPEKSSEDPFKNFFLRCEKDINNASKAVIENDIIKNLYHLQYMNSGGQKYYLLERESISQMIASVTSDIYSDYIIINKSGKILYTRTNNSIFGKNVKSHLKQTAYSKSFLNSTPKMYIQDIVALSPAEKQYSILLSKKLSLNIKKRTTTLTINILIIIKRVIWPFLSPFFNNILIKTNNKNI